MIGLLSNARCVSKQGRACCNAIDCGPACRGRDAAWRDDSVWSQVQTFSASQSKQPSSPGICFAPPYWNNFSFVSMVCRLFNDAAPPEVFTYHLMRWKAGCERKCGETTAAVRRAASQTSPELGPLDALRCLEPDQWVVLTTTYHLTRLLNGELVWKMFLITLVNT
jgi:hypothetical protein